MIRILPLASNVIMIQPEIIILEFGMIFRFGICIWDALKQGSHVLMMVFSGLLYGLILEWATIQQFHAYEYGQFIIMLDRVTLYVRSAEAYFVNLVHISYCEKFAAYCK